VAGKTGTSRDGWFVGFTPNLVCAVWVGFDDGSQLGLTGAASALPIWADFMSAALANHPEWTGDWQMPEGVQQQDIDPATGQIAQADSPNKRAELFINGTGPGSDTVEDTEVTAQEPATSDGQETNKDPNIEPAVLPDTPPPETLRAKPTPKGESRTKSDGRDSYEDGSPKLQGTITLDIDPTTGLIAVESCPVIRTKTFVIGQEPKKYCGPEYHKKPQPSPAAATRSRVVNP